MTTQNTLSKIGINAEVRAEDGDVVTLAATLNQFGKLQALIGADLDHSIDVSANRVVFDLSADVLTTLAESGKRARSSSRTQRTPDIMTTTVYDVQTPDDATNDVTRAAWNGDNGTITVNGSVFNVYATTAGDLMDDAPNPERTLFAFDCDVEGEPKTLHNGSMTGLIRRVVNFNKLIG